MTKIYEIRRMFAEEIVKLMTATIEYEKGHYESSFGVGNKELFDQLKSIRAKLISELQKKNLSVNHITHLEDIERNISILIQQWTSPTQQSSGQSYERKLNSEITRNRSTEDKSSRVSSQKQRDDKSFRRGRSRKITKSCKRSRLLDRRAHENNPRKLRSALSQEIIKLTAETSSSECQLITVPVIIVDLTNDSENEEPVGAAADTSCKLDDISFKNERNEICLNNTQEPQFVAASEKPSLKPEVESPTQLSIDPPASTCQDSEDKESPTQLSIDPPASTCQDSDVNEKLDEVDSGNKSEQPDAFLISYAEFEDIFYSLEQLEVDEIVLLSRSCKNLNPK